jgi:hypothetical protein
LLNQGLQPLNRLPLRGQFLAQLFRLSLTCCRGSSLRAFAGRFLVLGLGWWG